MVDQPRFSSTRTLAERASFARADNDRVALEETLRARLVACKAARRNLEAELAQLGDD